MAALALSASFSLPALPGEMAFQDPRLDKQSQRQSIGGKAGFSQGFGDPREIELADGYRVLAFRPASRAGDGEKRGRFWFPSSVVPSVIPHGNQAMGNDMHNSIDEIGQDCRARLSAALAKRLHPHTSLHRKQFAYALGAHSRSVDRWLNGDGGVNLEMIASMVRFFHGMGDHAFQHEVFGTDPGPVIPLAQVRAAMRSLVGELEEKAP